MNRFFKVLLSVLILVFAVCATFIGTVFWMQSQNDGSALDAVEYKMNRLEQMLDTYFVDDYDPDAVRNAAADGAAAAMVEATGDRWSYYISADEMADYVERTDNSYVGIGVTIQSVELGMQIVSVVPGGPAEEAGVQVGDICTKVGDAATAALGMEGTQELVRGVAGTYVDLTFLRGDEEYEVTVERRDIISDVAWFEMLPNDVALIVIADFDHHCAEQTLACIDEAMAQQAKAIIFDVRFNGGGLKDEMVQILDKLLPEGELFRSVDYRGVEEIDTSDAACLDIPMVVLVNEDSYSAAEFFAAALQEYGVAKVVGTKTTGKGNFQYTMELGDGSAVALSVGKYYTPGGISLTDVGVTPDVEAQLSYDDAAALYYGTLPFEEDEQLQAAINVLAE